MMLMRSVKIFDGFVCDYDRIGSDNVDYYDSLSLDRKHSLKNMVFGLFLHKYSIPVMWLFERRLTSKSFRLIQVLVLKNVC